MQQHEYGARAVPGPFTEEQHRKLDAEIERLAAQFPLERRAAALIPALTFAQEMLGWLPPDALEEVAKKVGVSRMRALEVGTFYTMLHLEKPGQSHVVVCNSISCFLNGSEKLLHRCREKLGPAHTPTADGKISWSEGECLASCGTAPALQVNEEPYRESVTVEKLDALIEELKRR